jgi:hypothetical protein
MTHYRESIARSLIESAYDDQRYAELLDRCARITKEREADSDFIQGVVNRVLNNTAVHYREQAKRWYRAWKWTMGALCAVVAGLVCWVIWRAL